MTEDFSKNGFIIIKKMFDANEVNQMKDAFLRMIEISKNLDSSTEIHNSKFIIENNVLKRVIWAGGIESCLLQYGQDLRLLKVIQTLLGVDSFSHILNQAHFKTPNDGVGFKPHQDCQNRDKKDGTWTDIDGKGSFIQSLIAIDNITEDNGPVWVIPKSHGKELTVEEINQKTLTEPKHIILMEAGDVAFWSSYLIHGSEPNTSENSRNTLINGFCLDGANQRLYTGSGKGVKIKL
jgi:ectoine hydroxylase-related dioxygenase (phytanoyl-CoA dioxygenase family)